ncbi:epoxide hydrolase family protein [Actinomycetospora soli]|uniref:epoxide hydrolase family protein n=1 Tax=Actinomycetospora soli TaxID=2893887 RepID=UPI001E3E7E3A|nr:epoxide hydrolase family protein [Actinomycetospora soli]MCD2189883.1 epoxide hydrolase [Actinomycetospora soli]
MSTAPATIRPFTVAVGQADLDDLQDRLARTRFPAPAPGDDWTYGTPTAYLREMVEAWRSFDWRAVEERINRFEHVLVEVDGRTVHAIHARSAEPTATPLLLAHSYPGSFLDFVDMIEPLVDPVAHGGRPEDAFHVVVPSMPGTGFSPAVDEPGWTTRRTAELYDRVMRGLGYESYAVHGSDVGATVARELGLLAPAGLLGIHVLQLFSFPSGDPAEFEGFGPEEYAALEHMQWFQAVGGYNQMNASRPQTVGALLADSPVAQLAYGELFASFGNGTSLLTRDQVLAQVTLAWLTDSGAAAARYYLEDARAAAEPAVNHTPTAVLVFPDDFRTIRSLAERDNSAVVRFTRATRGGHYASMENPAEIVADLRTMRWPEAS